MRGQSTIGLAFRTRVIDKTLPKIYLEQQVSARRGARALRYLSKSGNIAEDRRTGASLAQA